MYGQQSAQEEESVADADVKANPHDDESSESNLDFLVATRYPSLTTSCRAPNFPWG